VGINQEKENLEFRKYGISQREKKYYLDGIR
jgi:hypothetical protein